MRFGREERASLFPRDYPRSSASHVNATSIGHEKLKLIEEKNRQACEWRGADCHLAGKRT
jgi:hypothetical protein